MVVNAANFDDKITKHMRTDYAAVADTDTVAQAMEFIRSHGVGEQAVYFYVTNKQGRLVGVIPIRKLLMVPLDSLISQIMQPRVITIPDSFTVFDACEYFVLYKLLAFPVVDSENRLLGIIDVNLYTEEVLAISEQDNVDDFFESLGFRLSQVRNASFLKKFKTRFSWLLVTMVTGAACALLANVFHKTLSESIILALFLPLVLGLGESVCVQSLSLSIDNLRHNQMGWKWYAEHISGELVISISMGVLAALIAGGFAYIWRHSFDSSLAVFVGIISSMGCAAAIGFSAPVVLHMLKLDLKVAAGPVALALADLMTILCYLAAATLII